MLLRLLVPALLGLLAVPVVAASAYPSKPIRIVMTYPAGGSTDLVARLLANSLTEILGQQIVIDNRGGAGGIIGTEIAARAAPDGYTLLFGSSSVSINPLLQRKLPYNVERDFAPISLVVVNPQVLVAYPGLAANTIGELIKLARAHPGQINYASPGVGSPNHMGMELLKAMTGIDLVHVPYKGGGPAATDLIAGQVSLLFNSIPSVLPYMRSGRLKALAVGSAARSPAIPEIPTVAEAGVPGFEYATWYGLFAVAGTPQGIVARLNAAIAKALLAPELAQPLRAQGSEPRPTTPEDFARFIQVERARWERVVKATGLAGRVTRD
jgi:tripartite-type tricarboxylate transporter receptor subunit TctC